MGVKEYHFFRVLPLTQRKDLMIHLISGGKWSSGIYYSNNNLVVFLLWHLTNLKPIQKPIAGKRDGRSQSPQRRKAEEYGRSG